MCINFSMVLQVATRKEIENRGGVKCQLCSVFKMRKDQLKVHYEKYHGYQPKLAAKADQGRKTKQQDAAPKVASSTTEVEAFPVLESLLECPTCSESFGDNNSLIRHLLKEHCIYSGLICPYCTDHHPRRYIDLQVMV